MRLGVPTLARGLRSGIVGLDPIGVRLPRFGMLGAVLRRLAGDEGAAVAGVGGNFSAVARSFEPKRWRKDLRGGRAFAALLAVAAVGLPGVPLTPDRTDGAGRAGAGLGCRRSRTGTRLGVEGACRGGVATTTKSSVEGRPQGVFSSDSNGELSRLGGGDDKYEALESVAFKGAVSVGRRFAGRSISEIVLAREDDRSSCVVGSDSDISEAWDNAETDDAALGMRGRRVAPRFVPRMLPAT